MRAYEFLTRPRMAKIRLRKIQDHVESLKSVAERATVSFGLDSDVRKNSPPLNWKSVWCWPTFRTKIFMIS